MNKTEAINTVKLLRTLIDIGDASIIANTFLAAFKEKSIIDKNNDCFLQGNFNVGGTVSGRLSSSKPNLQNIPSNAEKIYAKLIKRCFIAPDGWLMVGADFDSLEDKISALTTRDPNKIRVYTEHYDGHCLRAYNYFGDQMPDIRQATDTERCFKIIQDNTTIYCKSGDIIVDSNGIEILIGDYYDTNKTV